MREKVRLAAVSGPLKGEQPFEFDQPDIFIFGRAADCHARLPGDDPTASRHHFVLAVQPPRVSVRDLGSLNGTFVNGRKIGARDPSETPEQGAGHSFEDVELSDGDEIRVGTTTLRVTVEQPVFCPQCGRPIEDVPLAEYVGWDDPRCPRCRERDRAPAPLVPEVRAPASGSDDPLAALVRALAGRPGKRGRRPGQPPSIPGYEIGRKLGEGGMGAVYLARRLTGGTEVAVKVMLAKREADERAQKLFAREVEMQMRLRGHPHCVALLEAQLTGYSSYCVMEYCPGGSIDQLMDRRGGHLSIAEAGPLMLGALDGLAYAHGHDIVHRDLKPQNVLLTCSEGGDAKLTDFGLAKDFEQAGITDMTHTGDVGGNPLGFPREQVLVCRHGNPVSDGWGIAATFYNMLTGAFVRDIGFGRDPINVILSQPPVPIRKRDSSIPRRLAAVIDQALSDDVVERYQTAEAFRQALEGTL